MVKVDGKIFLEIIFIWKKTQVHQIVPVLLRTLIFSISWVTSLQSPVFSDRLSPVTVGDPWAVLIVSFEVTRVGEEVGVQGSGRGSKSLPLRILSLIGTAAPE